MVIGKLISPIPNLQLLVQIGQDGIHILAELVIPPSCPFYRGPLNGSQTPNNTLITSTSTEFHGSHTLAPRNEPFVVLAIQRIAPDHAIRSSPTGGVGGPGRDRCRLDPVADTGNVELIVIIRRTTTHFRFILGAVLPIEQLRPEEELVS